MGDLIQLADRARPWEPGPGVETIAVLDEYNIPLAGVVRQQGHTYLYVCAAGEEDEANVWIYVLVEEPEVRRLLDARGNELLTVMAECMHSKSVVVALADDFRLVMWEWFDAGLESPGVIVRRFLRRLDARVRRYEEKVEVLTRDSSIDQEEVLC